MNWSLACATMEQRAIKTDVIASEDAYFMATHVPFANLEILHGGKGDRKSVDLGFDRVSRVLYRLVDLVEKAF